MNNNLNLRRVAALHTMGDSTLTDKFLAGNTENDLEAAERVYIKWRNGMEKQCTPQQSNAASYAIEGLVAAREQYAYEVGFSDGMRLLHEALAGHAPLLEIENRAREPV